MTYMIGAVVIGVAVIVSLVTLHIHSTIAVRSTTIRSPHRNEHHHYNNNKRNHSSHHSCYHSDTDDIFTSNTTNQCFLFPKLSLDADTVTTSTTTTTTTTTHRQLEDLGYLGQPLSDTANADGIRLSRGLVAKIIARSGDRVANTNSRLRFHRNPDGADVFALNNGAQYVYLSNAERAIPWTGGVYGVIFDAVTHEPLDYKAYLRRTTINCNGGRTPWNTWVSCEEAPPPLRGYCWQVDPNGKLRAQKLTMSGFAGGRFEAFAYDDRNTGTAGNSSGPSFYITEDADEGTLRRYRPPANTPMGWDMLHLPRNVGTLDYLVLDPTTSTFSWTTDMAAGRSSAGLVYPNSEGIAIHNGTLAFVSKVERMLFLLNLDDGTYKAVSTRTTELSTGGTFDGQPDHVISYPEATATNSERDGNLLFLTEDGGGTPGLFAYDGSDYLSVLEAAVGSYDGDEVTGIAFSPDGTKMYACLQRAGILFQVSRVDQEPFRHRRTLKWRKGLKL